MSLINEAVGEDLMFNRVYFANRGLKLPTKVLQLYQISTTSGGLQAQMYANFTISFLNHYGCS